jgi:hypothetical protein
VIAGWDDSECIKAFEAINNHTAINKKVKMIVNSKPGKKVKMFVNSKPGKETHSNETVNLINRSKHVREIHLDIFSHLQVFSQVI